MRMMILAALAAAVQAVAAPARADAQFECYATVHDGCFLHKPHCTQDEYEELLESCDYFGTDSGGGKAVARPLAFPTGLVAEGLTPARRLAIQRMIRRLHP